MIKTYSTGFFNSNWFY